MHILNQEDFDNITASGLILKRAMQKGLAAIKPGVSTLEVDEVVDSEIVQSGAVPSFKNYYVGGSGYFPAAACICINDELVHGIPKKDRIIKEGDIVSLDIGAKYNGMCTDMAYTVAVGEVAPATQRLLEVTKQSLDRGISEAKIGNKIGDIGYAVQSFAEANNLGVIRDLVGHGIGKQPHMAPQIPNYGMKNTGPRIVEGMALAIEPMLSLGDYRVEVGPDNWTITMADKSLCAHFEHTVVIWQGETHIVTD
ncbi:MAG: type I methionyl aminopeptidase [Candidatus Berkelbacteria bacterium]